ncbi:hypothetical protein [Tamaricihabitans halophyticus]|nr:hypothetical protein [Tamaricihabitans halophyticus]
MNSSFDPGNFDRMPPLPNASDQQQVSVPTTLVWALRAGIATVLCGLLTIALSTFSVSDEDIALLQSELAGQGAQLSTEELSDFTNTVTTMTFIIGLVLTALWLWLLQRTHRGRNWARITLTVLGAIWLVLTLPNLTAGLDSGFAILLNLVQVVLLGITLYFLHAKPTRDYFISMRAPRYN